MARNFFPRDSFDDKMAKKMIALIRRSKLIPIDEIECLYCSNITPTTQDFVVCTKNEVFYQKGLGAAPSKFEYKTITALTIEVKYASPCVALTIGQGEKVILHVMSKDAAPLENFIKEKLRNLPSAQPSYSSADEILKYKNLLDLGAITQDEYNAKKEQLINQ